ncbi:MAG: hypothetical protein LIO81_03675 [Clostridiales bacterium]|nr:hypothetical protein [Clostridiales bacterium]
MSKVMLIGLGRVGWQVMEYLVQDPKCPELVCCDISDEGQSLVDNAVIGASITGLFPTVSFYQMDLADVNATAKIIGKEQPDVIIDMSVMMPMHGFYKLPKEQFDYLYSATFGAWLPCQTALPYRLMQAKKMAGSNARVITSGLPDLVIPALASVGMAPDIGMGNIELNVAAMTILVSRKLKVPAECVKIYLVSEHAWVVYPRDPAYSKTPYFLRIMVNDKDVTSEFDTDQLMWDAIKLYPPAPSTVFYTNSAKSIINNMYALLSPSGRFTHAPGAKGLPGGYPVIISSKGVELALPQGITEEEAIAINREAQRIGEGIESINPDGTCVWTDYAHEVLKNTIGFTRKSFDVRESYDVALEMKALYNKYLEKYI